MHCKNLLVRFTYYTFLHIFPFLQQPAFFFNFEPKVVQNYFALPNSRSSYGLSPSKTYFRIPELHEKWSGLGFRNHNRPAMTATDFVGSYTNLSRDFKSPSSFCWLRLTVSVMHNVWFYVGIHTYIPIIGRFKCIYTALLIVMQYALKVPFLFLQ